VGFFNPVARGASEELRLDLAASTTGCAGCEALRARRAAAEDLPQGAAGRGGLIGTAMAAARRLTNPASWCSAGSGAVRVEGWVKVKSYTDPLEGIARYPVWELTSAAA